MFEIKNEENEVQADRNELLKIYIYTKLHSSRPQDQHPSLKNTSPDSSEVPPTMRSEVKKILKGMKNKAKGIDKLTSDVMILGGEESVKQLKQHFFLSDLRNKKDTS